MYAKKLIADSKCKKNKVDIFQELYTVKLVVKTITPKAFDKH
ncbi:hypothetical protein EDF66_11717 [Sphingobacterium sp. JUb20]|jgi:hypothetical protein|nr:hypothetical protein L950_0202145 [Sphingobacterium sp. IITKGP-BTPF85]MCS3557029.1 hypothetical protein [Sphingobacterium sp. JUb21]MCW2260372.1 hypothetical protein [Sphingobacterium kitahiroshimense]TCQ98072.1 hypothetical protein EDF66_11717 [Sphingobacterium sp. JUb20]